VTYFDGSVYRPSDAGYEAARCAAVWNGIKPNRFPAVIVVAGSHDDVPRAITLAAEEGLSVGIRSGGHSWVANAVRDGGLLLDLSRLKGIEIDPDAMTATIEPGVHVHELADVLTSKGLYFPVGHCPSVGLAGFILGGGFGFNSYELGPAAFSLKAVDVVTADGKTLRATDEENPEVIWAARGSGPGFFAVATRLYLQLRPHPPVVALSMQLHPLDAYDDLIAWYVDAAATAADNGCPLILVAGRQSVLGHDEPALLIVSYVCADDLEQAAEKLALMETAPNLERAILHQKCQPASIRDLYGLFDLLYPEGLRYLSDNVWIKDAANPKLWEEVRDVIDTLPTERSAVWLISFASHARHPNAAFSLQSNVSYQVYGVYDESTDDEVMLAWHHDALACIDQFSLGGGYVGDSNLFVHPMAILHPDSAKRLEALRDKYDSDRRFYTYPSALPPARV
jgi:FAD/FMN-containing dehydrogenase